MALSELPARGVVRGEAHESGVVRGAGVDGVGALPAWNQLWNQLDAPRSNPQTAAHRVTRCSSGHLVFAGWTLVLPAGRRARAARRPANRACTFFDWISLQA